MLTNELQKPMPSQCLVPPSDEFLYDKKTSIEAFLWRSDRVLAGSFTEGMPEADAEALRHALRNS
ncbi:hypothetical protein EDM55_11865 [Brevibacillus centrosporus]|nr:hypothetical protein EDM55_11865 [Brevibacillus centrosporus]